MKRQKPSGAGRDPQAIRESFERIGAELSNLVGALAPSEEVLSHFRAARIEVLKGLRAAIDAQIDRATQDRQKGTQVTVE